MKITIKDKDYTIRDYYSIGQYVDLYKIKDLFEDDYYEIRLISIMTGAKQDDILKLPHNQIKEISSFLINIMPSTQFIFEDSFTLNGIEYGFIPEYKNMSFAEFVDLDTLLTKKPDEIMSNLHIIAAIMFRPIVSKKSKHNYKIEDYDSEKVDERAELFKKDLDIKYVLGGKYFFSKSVKTYLTSIQPSLIWKKPNTWLKTLKLFWKMRKLYRLKKRSGGSLSLTELLEMTLQNTKQYSKKEP
jgi:hypothetical protein